jgi:hypothetical protein
LFLHKFGCADHPLIDWFLFVGTCLVPTLSTLNFALYYHNAKVCYGNRLVSVSYGWLFTSVAWSYNNLTLGGTFAGGLLSFKPSIPKSLLLSGEHNVESHFTLINHQVYTYRPDPIHVFIWWNFDVAFYNFFAHFFSFFFRWNRLGQHLQLLLFWTEHW